MADSATLARLLAVGALLLTGACASYPRETMYPVHAGPAPARSGPAPAQPPARVPDLGAPRPSLPQPARPAETFNTAPVASIEGAALPPPTVTTTTGATRAASEPAWSAPPPPARETAEPPASRPAAAPARPTSSGVSYEIQPGDTLSGVGRRFRTPVQALIHLNSLGPQGAIRPGQRLQLPDSAEDQGPDPYATGPSPVGVAVPSGSAPPPPPPPVTRPSQPQPQPSRPAATPPPAAADITLAWPVRGDILRRFGPVGLGERNNGVNIGAPAGAEVRASAAGRVGYVGDDLAGQGLTVLIVHRGGWRTVYSHLGSESVSDGQEIQAGQVIGTVGATAGDGRPSIHYEVWRMQGDEPRAIDPLGVLPR